jgi:hypothetical protein
MLERKMRHPDDASNLKSGNSVASTSLRTAEKKYKLKLRMRDAVEEHIQAGTTV